MASPAKSVSLLRRPSVEARTGLRRSTIYELVSAGRFPAPLKLTGRTVAWRSDEVDNWIAERIAAANGGGK